MEKTTHAILLLASIWIGSFLSGSQANAANSCSQFLQDNTPLRTIDRNGLSLPIPAQIIAEPGQWQRSEPIRAIPKGHSLKRSFQDSNEVYSLNGKKAIAVETYLIESEEWTGQKDFALAYSQHRILKKARFESEHVFVDVIDTEIRWGLPPQIISKAKALGLDVEALPGQNEANLFNHQDPKAADLLKSAHLSALQEGRAQHLSALKEILDFTFPLYRDRRGWNEDFIKDLNEKAVQTLNSTRYIIVRKKLANGNVGPIIANLGLTRAPYGAIEFFNKATGRRERHFGPFGSAYDLSFISEAEESHRGYASAKLWDQPVPVVPTEAIFGTGSLPRPLVADWPFLVDTSMTSRIVEDFAKRKIPLSKNGIAPDFTKPVTFSTGQIIEPVKFGVAKEEDLRGVAYVEVLKEMFAAIFPTDLNSKFTKDGQILMTYNDHDGTVMYRRMGFSVPGEVPKKIVDGIEWTPLLMTPEKLITEIISKKGLTEEEAKSFFNSLTEIFNSKKGSYKKPS
jgi:hypothetical protein